MWIDRHLEAMAGGSEVECMGPSLDAPLVSPLNCMAMAVELPPISTEDSCSMTGREVVVQMRLPGEPWGDVQRDVQSGSVIVGDLDPLQAVEFRIALRSKCSGSTCHGGDGGAAASEGACDTRAAAVAMEVGESPLAEAREG